VIVGGVVGIVTKFATNGFIANNNYLIDFSKLPKQIGSFTLEGERNRDGSLQFRSTQCEKSIFINAYSIIDPPPEAFSELLYPSNKWRTLYVYDGQTYDTFARIPAYMRLVALRSIEALTISARSMSDEYLFSFHIPVECVVDHSAAVEASNSILDLGLTTSQ
jgi:hypothetical protein